MESEIIFSKMEIIIKDHLLMIQKMEEGQLYMPIKINIMEIGSLMQKMVRVFISTHLVVFIKDVSKMI